MDIFAVIMAGGKGTRFWPLSRIKKPKQFLPISSELTMLEETAARLQPEIPPSHIYTIAGPEHNPVIAQLMPDLPAANLLQEPQGKNTAPSLLLATAVIYLKDPQGVVAALPADHLITDGELFRQKIRAAAAAAFQNEHIITFGIPPHFPATGYGYIKFLQENPLRILNEDFFMVQEFKEKPDRETAQEFISAGCYYWNSGMFLWRADVFAAKLQRFAPDMFYFWEQLLEALQNGEPNRLAEIFAEIPAISIDYALMEKAEGVAMCRGNFGWSDVGAWSALEEIWEKDQNNNAVRGACMALDSSDCVVYNPSRLTALIGVRDIIAVDTPDVLLICRKDLDQKVKDIVTELYETGRKELL